MLFFLTTIELFLYICWEHCSKFQFAVPKPPQSEFIRRLFYQHSGMRCWMGMSTGQKVIFKNFSSALEKGSIIQEHMGRRNSNKKAVDNREHLLIPEYPLALQQKIWPQHLFQIRWIMYSNSKIISILTPEPLLPGLLLKSVMKKYLKFVSLKQKNVL